MGIQFSPYQLAYHYDEAGSGPISRDGHLAFRNALIELLRKLRTKVVDGTIEVTGLSIGSSQDFVVDHSSDAEFGLCEYPIITAMDGVDVQIFALVDVSGSGEVTNGSGFAGRITNVSVVSGSFTLSWTRTGMLA